MANKDDITGGISFTPDTTKNPVPGALAGTVNLTGEAASVLRQVASGPTQVTLARSSVAPTSDQLLWTAIRNRSDAIGFNRYIVFIERLLCERADPGSATCGGDENAAAGQIGSPSIDARLDDLIGRPSLFGNDSYQLLKLATHAFLLYQGGIAIEPAGSGGAQLELDEEARLGRPITLTEARTQLEQYLRTQVGTVQGRILPYLKRVVDALIPIGLREEGSPFCDNVLRRRLHCPQMIELIHDFWLDQAGLTQSMNAILLRFQNRRRGTRDPLSELAFDPLRPMAQLLFGRLADEPNHLSVKRLDYEYRNLYGIGLYGQAVEGAEPAESRTRFLEAFHILLQKASDFYEDDAQTTVIADGDPALHCLRELHLVLAEGAVNEFEEVKFQARQERLIDMLLMARAETREFLRGRAMVPYPERWMGPVDMMKRLQGWLPQVSVREFHILATTSEKLLLSVRNGDWSAVIDQAAAVNWLRYFKPEIRGYLHAYQAVTGVDLAADGLDARRAADRYVEPSVHLRRRMLEQRGRAALAYESQERTLVADESMDYLSARPARRGQ